MSCGDIYMSISRDQAGAFRVVSEVGIRMLRGSSSWVLLTLEPDESLPQGTQAVGKYMCLSRLYATARLPLGRRKEGSI